MKKIENIWKDLEVSASKGGGIVYRRYSVNIVPPLYVAIRRSDFCRCLALVFKDREAVRNVELIAMKGLEFEIQTNSAFPNQYLLLILSPDRKNEDVFATLAEDLIKVVANENSEPKLITSIHRRLLVWKSLFDETASNGLSLEAQLGLVGELALLKTMIGAGKPIDICIQSWIGPSSANRDFEYAGWAAEVKSTMANQHHKISVSNERQLDNTHLDRLYLCFYAFEVQPATEPTLNTLVKEIRTILELHPHELDYFERNLTLAGYFDKHHSLYENHGFIERQHALFHVTDEFPCIRESDLPIGVGDIHYSIMLSAISHFTVSLTELLF